MQQEYTGNQWQCAHCGNIERRHNPEHCGRCGGTGLHLISGTLPTELAAPSGGKREYRSARRQLEGLTPKQREKLETVVFGFNHNPLHEDDYFNAGGFMAHWSDYTADERDELIKQVTQ